MMGQKRKFREITDQRNKSKGEVTHISSLGEVRNHSHFFLFCIICKLRGKSMRQPQHKQGL